MREKKWNITERLRIEIYKKNLENTTAETDG
jgi:hypothetical protein